MKSTRSAHVPKTPKSAMKFAQNGGSQAKDPVQAYCRLRPMQSETEVSCLKVMSESSVLLSPPTTAANYRSMNYKEIKYKFRKVFQAHETQNEIFNVVARPMVENLVQGRNGLLLTYGVTGSGKTFTMVGDKQNPGIMQRSVEVLYKTIANNHAKKYIFKPDKLNGFDVQSEADACADRQAELSQKYSKTPKRCNSDLEIASISDELPPVEGIDDDNIYSVFVTFAEIYNNSVYDLLEDTTGSQRSLQNRMVREDGARNMYLHGVTEVECKSTEEAIEVFNRGLKRKKMGCTSMNSESSRSHSVFTIRLVQAPTDQSGENVIQEKKVVCISQLSLVDLAGSERAVRTKNSGVRLREACCINNSLMTLRSCLDILRENQLTGSNKIVPYRDSKLTHLFKNFFDGEGQVRMVICVNPRADDYDETIQVMKFAELTQEVQVSRAMTFKSDTGLTPGRRKINREFKQAVAALKENVNIDLGLVYNLGTFPTTEWVTPPAEGIKSLQNYLEMRISKRAELLIDVSKKEEKFRAQILDAERERLTISAEGKSLKSILIQERLKVLALEEKVALYESKMDTLQRQLQEQEKINQHQVQEINEKALLLNQNIIEKQKQERVFHKKIAQETEKISKDHELRLKEQQAMLKNELKNKTQKIRMASKILDNNKFAVGHLNSDESTTSTESFVSLRKKPSAITQPVTQQQVSKRGVAVANARHRRSRSVGCEVWLEHRAVNPVPLGTVMQPVMRKRKSVTKLTDVKDVANMKTSKYCLVSQEQDSGGELETRLYKGDVIPSCGGGAQVIFNDVETLKQYSPNSSPSRKRINDHVVNDIETVESRCSIAIEGNKKARIH